MSPKSDGLVPELILNRFCGREVYPICKATWNLYSDDRLGMANLFLSIEAERGTVLHDDTRVLCASPWWEVNIVERELTRSALIPGSTFRVPSDDDTRGGYLTTFYYCRHESSDSNVVQILDVDGERLSISITGKTRDVNFYDGSKPPTVLSAEGWFLRDPDARRSI